MEIAVHTREGTTVGKIDLPEAVFNVSTSKHLLHEAVCCFLANQRQGTASTKGRSEVKASGRKPWRQKGTGRARSGTVASPVWVGGGIAHGPKPRDYCYYLPKKARRLAIKGALSIRAKEGNLKVVDSFDLAQPRTKEAVKVLSALGVEGSKCLLIVSEKRENLLRATSNLPRVRVMIAKDINVYDVLDSEKILVEKEAVAMIAEVLK
ncbi:MAG: 50S ribosomal protein L4 [bacterium]